MADRIKNSQQRHTLNRFINSGDRKDVLFPKQHASIPAALGAEWKFIGPNSVATLGSQTVFDLPKTGYIQELFLEFNFNAPAAGNYTTYPALSCVDRISLLAQSGNELHDYDYVTVMQTIFANMNVGPKNTILQASGGTSFNSGRCVAPVPTWFSQLGYANNDLNPNEPLPAHLLNGKMRLEVNLKSLADVLDAGASGGSLASMRLWYLHYQVDDNLRNEHFQKRGSYNAKAVDWQTNINNAVTASTSTNFDISGFHGSLHTVYVMNKSTANKTTANDYYLLSDINDSRLLADGDQLYDTDSNNTQLLQGLFSDGIFADTTFGEPLVINFGYANSSNKAKHYVGSLHLNDVNQFELDSLSCSATGT
jgi:hypothetical protein